VGNVQVVYGRWLIDGYPKVVLFDIAAALWKVDDWKQEIWDTSHIGIPWVDQEATDAVAFGFLTAIFLNEVRCDVIIHRHHYLRQGKKVMFLLESLCPSVY